MAQKASTSTPLIPRPWPLFLNLIEFLGSSHSVRLQIGTKRICLKMKDERTITPGLMSPSCHLLFRVTFGSSHLAQPSSTPTTNHLKIKRSNMLRERWRKGEQAARHHEAAPRSCDNSFGEFLTLVTRLWGVARTTPARYVEAGSADMLDDRIHVRPWHSLPLNLFLTTPAPINRLLIK